MKKWFLFTKRENKSWEKLYLFNNWKETEVQPYFTFPLFTTLLPRKRAFRTIPDAFSFQSFRVLSWIIFHNSFSSRVRVPDDDSAGWKQKSVFLLRSGGDNVKRIRRRNGEQNLAKRKKLRKKKTTAEMNESAPPNVWEILQGKQGVKEAGRRRVGGALTEGVGIRPRKCKLSCKIFK